MLVMDVSGLGAQLTQTLVKPSSKNMDHKNIRFQKCNGAPMSVGSTSVTLLTAHIRLNAGMEKPVKTKSLQKLKKTTIKYDNCCIVSCQ